MDWIEIKNRKPKPDTWVLIQSSLKNTPKYEVCFYDKNSEWYMPSYDDVCEEKDIIKWSYIE